MRASLFLMALSAPLLAQQPILYYRGAVNAASLAPFGLPNAPIARGSVFTVFGENLGPGQSPTLSFPLGTALGGVSLSVIQSGVSTAAYPIFVSASQINAVMPSTVKAGAATLRLTYQGKQSNAATVFISDASPVSLPSRAAATVPALCKTTSATATSRSIRLSRRQLPGKS